MQNVIRVLLNKERIKLRELSREASVPLGVTVKNTKALERTGYIEKTVYIKVTNKEKLTRAWSYAVSIDELEKIEFSVAERPQFAIKRLSGILSKIKATYAFTLFSATEIIAPYVTPAETHLYILEKDKEKVKKAFNKESILPALKGNVVCFLVDKSYFYCMKEVRGSNVVSLPQLYVDLFSYGGRGADAAENLIEVIKNV